MLENEGLGNIARDIRHTRTEGEKMAGGLVADYQNNIDGFTKAEFDNFLGVIQGTTRASSPMIAAAARAENTRLSRVQGQLGNRNINLDPITSTRTDRALLSDYYTAASRDIQEYQNLGPRVNKIPVDVRTEIDAIKSTGGDYRTAYEFADAYFNPDHLRRVERTMWDRMSSFEIATKLGQSVISNATQSANTALVTGNMTLLKNIARNLTNTSALDALANEISGRVPMSNRELGLRSGSTLSSVTHETQLTSGVKPRGFTDKMLEYTGFSPIEVHNRVVASMSGAEHAVKMFQELKKNPNDTTARRHLSYWLGLDPDVLKNQSQITLDQVLTAAHTLSDRTQHRTSPLEIPLSWRSSVEAKMITLFKSFAFNQAKFMKEVTLNEMKGGNFRTLIPLFTLVPILGTLADRMKRLVTGRDQPKNYWDAVIGAYSSVGGIGIISDLAARAAVGKLAEAVGGPVFSDSVEMIENLFKPKPAKKVKKQLIRNIPVAGKTLVNTDLAK